MSATGEMRLKTRFLDWIDDRINPIVVREMRQAVHSRFVAAVLIVFPAIQLIAIGIYLAAAGDISMDFGAGRGIFMMLHIILLVACLLFVPAYSAVRLAAERSDTNVDLLFITTIRPRSIIGGKTLAALTITALMFSSCQPFMAFTYFLRGIDIPSMLILQALSFFVVAACVQAAIFVACIPTNKIFKVLLGVVCLVLFVIAFVATVGGSMAVIQFGVGSRSGSMGFWGPAVLILLSGGTLIGLFYFLSVALITPLTANRALPARAFAVVIWLVSGIVTASWTLIAGENWPLVVWNVLGTSVFSIGLLAAVSERELIGRRVAQSIPAERWRRAWAFFFYSGAASGVAWACVMIGLTLAVSAAMAHFSGPFRKVNLIESIQWMAVMGLYVFSYAMTARLVRHRFFDDRIHQKYTWIIALILMGMGSLLPITIGFVFFSGNWQKSEDAGLWLIGNPFAFGMESHWPIYMFVAGSWAIIVLALSRLWFLEQIRQFQRPMTNDQ